MALGLQVEAECQALQVEMGIQEMGIQETGIQEAGLQVETGIQKASIQVETGIQKAGLQDGGVVSRNHLMQTGYLEHLVSAYGQFLQDLLFMLVQTRPSTSQRRLH
ncbi:MAG: hypothetical protein ACYSUX_12010 [Planctomycetota bacterium]